MIAFLIPYLVKSGLSERLAKLGAWLLVMLAILAFAALLFFSARAVVEKHDETVKIGVQAEYQNSSDAAIRANDLIVGAESVSLANDQATAVNQQKEQDHASSTAPAGSTGAATRAANCVRWKQQHPNAVPPAACR